MTWVRRHQRQTASGKVVSVRAHDRDADPGSGRREQDVEVPEWVQPVYVAEIPVTEPVTPDDIWADEDPAGWMDQFRADAAALRARDAERPVAVCPVCARPLNGPDRSCACAPTAHNVAEWDKALRDAGY